MHMFSCHMANFIGILLLWNIISKSHNAEIILLLHSQVYILHRSYLRIKFAQCTHVHAYHGVRSGVRSDLPE